MTGVCLPTQQTIQDITNIQQNYVMTLARANVIVFSGGSPIQFNTDGYQQKNGSVDVLNYVHRHMLRGSFTGAFGENIASTASAGQEISRTYSTKLLPSNVNVNQVYIYALLFDNTTREIIQVEEKKLIP